MDQKLSSQKKIAKLLSFFPLWLAFSMGFSFYNSLAVISGFTGKISTFVRTPKFNIVNVSDSWKRNQYLVQKFGASTFFEGLLALYFLFGLLSAFRLEDFALAPFHFMLSLGFSLIFIYSISEANASHN
jgi:hypothetical protein